MVAVSMLAMEIKEGTVVIAPSRLARVADFAFRRRRLVLAGWISALIVGFALSAAFGGAFSADYNTPGSESKAAADALASRFPQRSPNTTDVVWVRGDAAAQQRMRGFLEQAGALPGLRPASGVQVSPDGKLEV